MTGLKIYAFVDFKKKNEPNPKEISKAPSSSAQMQGTLKYFVTACNITLQNFKSNFAYFILLNKSFLTSYNK